LERQQSLLCQGIADSLAREADNIMLQYQHEFGKHVEALLATYKSKEIGPSFDNLIRASWPPADVGFVVTETCVLVFPSLYSGPVEKNFYDQNKRFLCSIQSAEVYNSNLKN